MFFILWLPTCYLLLILYQTNVGIELIVKSNLIIKKCDHEESTLKFIEQALINHN